MNHSGTHAKRVVKRLWKLGWGLVFVSIMTVLSVLGADYSSHFAVAKSLVPPTGTSTAALR
jgi:quinol-cytochrome oxidoreductase complex cytochrome b subunit